MEARRVGRVRGFGVVGLGLDTAGLWGWDGELGEVDGGVG